MSPRVKRSQSPLAVVPVRDYSNTELKLAAAGFTSLLVNLERMTSKPNAGGGSKDCVAREIEKAWKVKILGTPRNFDLR